MDCSPPVSFVHGISQVRILEWFAISSSRGSSWPRDWTHVSWVSCISCFGRWILYHSATGEANDIREKWQNYSCKHEQEAKFVSVSCVNFGGKKITGFNSNSYLLAVWPWASYFASLSLSCFVSIMEIIIYTFSQKATVWCDTHTQMHTYMYIHIWLICDW